MNENNDNEYVSFDDQREPKQNNDRYNSDAPRADLGMNTMGTNNQNGGIVPNGMGVASLVLGIIGLVLFFCGGFIVALIGLGLGIAQLVIFSNNKDKSQEGRGIALAGVIISAIAIFGGIGLNILFWLSGVYGL